MFPSLVGKLNLLRLLFSLGYLRSKFLPLKRSYSVFVYTFRFYTAVATLSRRFICAQSAVPSLSPTCFPTVLILYSVRNLIFRLALQKSSVPLWHFHSPKHCCFWEELGCDILCCVTLGKRTRGEVGQEMTDDSCSQKETPKQRTYIGANFKWASLLKAVLSC